MNDHSPTSADTTLTQQETQQLRKLLHTLGEPKLRERLGLGKLPMARIIAGLPTLRATVALTRAGIASLTKGVGK